MSNPLGKLSKEKDGFRVVFERTFNHPIEKVWDAISNPEKLKVWFTDFEMDPQAGSRINIIFRDEAQTVTTGEVIEIDPPHRFVWTWEGELAVWELCELGEKKCKLTFTYSKLVDKYAVGAAGGFHTLMERLESMLNGSEQTYAFGTEEFDPQQIAMREAYGLALYDEFPELEVYHPVKLERTYHASAPDIWEALTKDEKLKQWYFDFKGNFKPVAGHTFDWEAGPPAGRQWLHRGTVLEVEEHKKLVHTWSYPGYSGEGKLTWELEEITPDQTLLRLQFDILTVFDPTEEALRRKNFAQGWREILDHSLKAFLEK